MIDLATIELDVEWLSDDDVRALSQGALSNAWAINERTLKPERGGLHCAQIFGPVEDLSCICTKYQGEQHRDVTCEKCGVLVTDASVRMTRFGHVELATPLTHPWSGAEVRALLVLPAGLREIDPERARAKLTGINALYAALVKRNEMVARCVDKDAPSVLMAHETQLLQAALDAVFGEIPKRPSRRDKLGVRIRRHLAEGQAPHESPLRETLLAAGACA